MRLRNVKKAGDILEDGKYYLSNYKDFRGRFKDYFGNDNPIYLEIGTGKGDFIIESSMRNKDINYIGMEKYDSVIVRAIQKSNEVDVNNLAFIRANAIYLEDIFDREIDTILLNFSDPWPKDRHSDRRLTSRKFLERYDKIFRGAKRIIMKTDNVDLFDFSLESLRDYGYTIVYENRNLGEDEDGNVMTEYEKRFRKLGEKINKLVAYKED
jgi:tRNA (guanine-N7-)-methyltransferase